MPLRAAFTFPIRTSHWIFIVSFSSAINIVFWCTAGAGPWFPPPSSNWDFHVLFKLLHSLLQIVLFFFNDSSGFWNWAQQVGSACADFKRYLSVTQALCLGMSNNKWVNRWLLPMPSHASSLPFSFPFSSFLSDFPSLTLKPGSKAMLWTWQQLGSRKCSPVLLWLSLFN